MRGPADAPQDTAMSNPDDFPPELPEWLRGDPIAEHLHAQGLVVTRAAWLEAAYGTSNETTLVFDKEMREWVRRHFPADPHEPVR
jgi:hypothetical protein